MSWRRKPRTINEELRGELPPQDEPSVDGRGKAGSLRRVAAWLVIASLIIALKEGVTFLPTWIALVLGALFVSHYVWIFVHSTRRKAVRAGGLLRVFVLVWLAICVVTTVLVGLGGFQTEDRALLGVVWPILGLIWVVYRLRVAAASPRTETGSRSPSR